FQLLYRLEETGHNFRLALAGENFRNVPGEFEEAKTRLAHRIEHWGFLPSRSEYLALLREADLVVSTADHEFFGISILEAVQAGVFPLLPNRLSYPELIPPDLHAACLYENEDDLYVKAVARLAMPRQAPPSLRRAVQERYSWPVVAESYDCQFSKLLKMNAAPAQ
ncbi:MAG: glycosyltransferase, partial [Caldilineaceae bacterium]|nr:glycosyltransferase [Caldilineaceae bacterium]